MFDCVGEIEEFYDNSKMIDVWFEWDGCKGLVVHYNCHAKAFCYDDNELVEIVRTLDVDTTDGEFLEALGVYDHKEVCTTYQNISLLSESKPIKCLLPRIQEMFKSIGIGFNASVDSVYFDFKGGRILKLEYTDFEFLFELHIGLMIGVYPERDMYVELKKWQKELMARRQQRSRV